MNTFYSGYPFPGRNTGNKYHNQKTKIGDMVFDSKKEANRFQELRLLERGGVISDLKMQVRFLICPKSSGNKRARYYVADFVYNEGGKTIIEDVKSEITRKKTGISEPNTRSPFTGRLTV